MLTKKQEAPGLQPGGPQGPRTQPEATATEAIGFAHSDANSVESHAFGRVVASPHGEIPLTRGFVAVVDADDFEWLSRFHWHVDTSNRRTFYARARINGETVAMHRLIMGLPTRGRSPQVDHINSDGLDNRRSNLRVCDPSENTAHSRLGAPESGYRGVCAYPGGWKAFVTFRGVNYDLGVFDDPLTAARARDAKALELHGEFAVLTVAVAS